MPAPSRPPYHFTKTGVEVTQPVTFNKTDLATIVRSVFTERELRGILRQMVGGKAV